MSITILIVAATVIISLMAFNNHQLIDKFVFWPYRMWRDGEWHRLITCGFIHADWGHLIFNMIALYSFGTFVEQAFGYMLPMGVTLYIVMYFLAIVTADAYNLYNRKNPFSIYTQPNADNTLKTEAVQLSIIGSFIPAVTYNFTF